MPWGGEYNEKGESLGHEKSRGTTCMGLKVLKSVGKVMCGQNLSWRHTGRKFSFSW